MKIMRVFPRRTNATPDDSLTAIGHPEEYVVPNRIFSLPDYEEVHISVLFSHDIPKVESLKDSWDKTCDIVKIGGPAFGDPGGEFAPGLYVKRPYVITSRGCPNNCWFCDVWRREGDVRELPIKDGSNILDSNLLACSESHIKQVFEMLKRQPERPQFTGGLEAARLKDWHVKLLRGSKTDQMFFAYDTPDDYEPLREAGNILRLANFTRRHLRCYVLVGYPQDNFGLAKKRLLQAWECGFMPMAMLWRDSSGVVDKEWQRFQRLWARPAIIKEMVMNILF
ncbi:MAG: hypothetical protein V3U02_08140 [Calditrichia bacterium]